MVALASSGNEHVTKPEPCHDPNNFGTANGLDTIVALSGSIDDPDLTDGAGPPSPQADAEPQPVEDGVESFGGPDPLSEEPTLGVGASGANGASAAPDAAARADLASFPSASIQPAEFPSNALSEFPAGEAASPFAPPGAELGPEGSTDSSDVCFDTALADAVAEIGDVSAINTERHDSMSISGEHGAGSFEEMLEAGLPPLNDELFDELKPEDIVSPKPGTQLDETIIQAPPVSEASASNAATKRQHAARSVLGAARICGRHQHFRPARAGTHAELLVGLRDRTRSY